MIELTLSETDACYVRDILTMWIDGHDDAEEQTMSDANLSEVEDMLAAIDDLRLQKESAKRIRDYLDEVTYDR